MARRIYGVAGAAGINLDLFSDRDINALDPDARHVYQKACRRPSRIEREIQKALMSGRSVRKGKIAGLISDAYGHEVLKFFEYAQCKDTTKRKSGDRAILHEHATQARVGRAFPPRVQGLAISHDSVEDNAESIVQMEYNLWELGTRRWRFSEEQTDSLRLLTNVYRMILKNAEERAKRRDKGYGTTLLLAMHIPEEGDVKQHIREGIAEMRQKLDRRQQRIKEPSMRDLETIVEQVDVDGMSNKEAVLLIGEEAEMYASQKLYARTMRREIESQHEFLDQSVDSLLLQRKFMTAFAKLNVAKHAYLNAVKDKSETEKQGVFLKLASGLYEAMELIDESLGPEKEIFSAETEKATELKHGVKDCCAGIDDKKYARKLLMLARRINSGLGRIPEQMLDVNRLRQSNGLVREQRKEQKALSFERAMGEEYGIFDTLLLNLADAAEQIVVRNKLMYLNALSPSLNAKKVSTITVEDLVAAKDEAVKKLRERYEPYFRTVIEIIDQTTSVEGTHFPEAVTMNAYRRYIEDILNAERETYLSHTASKTGEPYRGMMIVKIFDAVDNVRTAPMDSKDAISRLISKVLIIEKAARGLEMFYRSQDAPGEVTGGIRGARLVLVNEMHGALVENAKLQASRRDNIFREGVMVPYLLEQAEKLYEERRNYLV